MKFNIKSIRYKLTFYYLLIFTTIFCVVASAILYSFKKYLITEGKYSLRDKSFVLGAWIDFSLPSFQLQLDDYIGSQNAPLMAVLYDRNGAFLGHSSSFPKEYILPKNIIEKVIKDNDAVIYESKDKKYVIVVNNLYFNDKLKGFVQLYQAREHILKSYYYLFRIILIIGILSLLLSFLAGLFFITEIIKPLNSIISTVDKIQAEKIHTRRLTYKNPDDELGRLSITINNMLDRLEKAFLVQKQFLSDAAHELRTPLTILKGNTEVAIMKNGVSSGFLSDNLEEINHLISLTNNLLFIARFEADAEKPNVEEFDLSDLVLIVVNNFQDTMRKIGITLETLSAGNTKVIADKNLIRRVLYNLIDNAAKHSKGTHISISMHEEYQQIVLQVRDNGKGIPEDKLPYIFDRFYRVRDEISSAEGSGLGLSIAKAIADLHRFPIKVESKVNEGASFSIYFKQSDYLI